MNQTAGAFSMCQKQAKKNAATIPPLTAIGRYGLMTVMYEPAGRIFRLYYRAIKLASYYQENDHVLMHVRPHPKSCESVNEFLRLCGSRKQVQPHTGFIYNADSPPATSGDV